MDQIFDIDDVLVDESQAALSAEPAPAKSRRELLVEKALSLFASLIFVNNEEYEARLEQIRNLPEEGLKELISHLERAAQKQRGYFNVLTSRDHMFPSKVKMMAYKGEMAILGNNKDDI